MEWKRHTLLDISDPGREDLLSELAGRDPDRRQQLARILLPQLAGARIPGVVRRDEGGRSPDRVPVGFSAPLANEGGRQRVAAFARTADILRSTSPYEVLARPAPEPRNSCLRALDACRLRAEARHLQLGVWGSAALELYTGLPCTHQASDLDLLVAAAPYEDLCAFLAEVEAIECRFGLRIDVELDLPSGYGVQLKELCRPGPTVLGKSLKDVQMLPREALLAGL